MKELIKLFNQLYKNGFNSLQESCFSCSTCNGSYADEQDLYNLLSIEIEAHYRFDLQLFAKAEDEGRTEDPTEYKKKKARDEGKVIKSQELVSSLVLLISFWALALFIGMIINSFKMILGDAFILLNNVQYDISVVHEYLVAAFYQVLYIITPIFVTAFVIAILANVVQIGFLFTTKPLTPEVSKISFTFQKMIERVFYSRQTMANLLKSIFKVSVVLGVATIIIASKIDTIVRMIDMPIEQSFEEMGYLLFALVNAICIAFVLMSIPDYMNQRKEHTESLKMSRYELKHELKDTEGDPYLKSKLREKQRELMNRRMMENVPKADVVITNPTHYAVAIQYEYKSMPAPIVVAKGIDEVAQRIKKIAERNEVYILENKALAQDLYREVEVGDFIPEHFFQIVADILAMIYRIKDKVAYEA